MTLAGDFLAERELAVPSMDELFDAIRDDELPSFMRTVFDRTDRRLPGEGEQDLRFFFRGQDDATWGISSSLFRQHAGPSTEKVLAQAEALVIDRMRVEGLGYRATDGELLMLLQHHGIPTRLVDVSDRPLPALYFAAEKKDGIDGRLFILALRKNEAGDVATAPLSGAATPLPWSDAAHGDRYTAADWSKSVRLVEEIPLDPRMQAQEGRFLVGGLMRRYSGEVLKVSGIEIAGADWPKISTLKAFFPMKRAASTSVRWPAIGWSIRIPAHWKSHLRSLLKEEGLTADHLYPDFAGCRRLGVDVARRRAE